MRLYRPKSVVSKYYAILFSLPHWRVLAGFIIGILCLIVLFMGEASKPFILYFFSAVIVLYVYSRLTPGTVFWKFKRILGLALTSLLYVLIYTKLLGDWVAAVAASASLISVVVLGLDGTRLWRYSVPIALATLPLSIGWLVGGLKKVTLVNALLATVLISLTDFIIYKIINRRGIDGYGAGDIGTLFLKNWLDKDKSIETFFEEVGSPRDVELAVLKSGETILIHTSLHYGPFSNVGSSLLPEELERVFAGKYSIVVFHGFGSHDRDVVSGREASKLTQLIISGALSEGEELMYHGSFAVSGPSSWRVVGLVFDKLLLLLISRPVLGIDDLPYSFSLKYSRIALEKLGSKLLLVETHNWERPGPPDTKGLDEALTRAVEEAAIVKRSNPTPVLVRSLTIKVNSPGVVNGVARLVEFKGEDGRSPVLLVFFRGNNMAPGSRDEVIKALSGEFNGLIEVLTNDEHIETGVRAHITYVPVHITEEALSSLKEGLKRLIEKPYSRGLRLTTFRLKLKLLNNVAYELEYLLKKSYLETTLLLIAYVFLVSPILARLLLTLLVA